MRGHEWYDRDVRTAALVLAAGFSVGCGPTNIGQGCDILGQEACGRLATCTGEPSAKSACLLGFSAGCCDGVACTAPVKDPTRFANCRNQLSTVSCTLIAQAVLPEACFGVLAPATPADVLGGTCSTENAARCDPTAPRLLQCTNGIFTLFADCKGSRGCTTTSTGADCDTSGNTLGDHCAPTSEGKARCDPVTRANILKCTNGVLVLVHTCTPSSKCGLTTAGELTCI